MVKRIETLACGLFVGEREHAARTNSASSPNCFPCSGRMPEPATVDSRAPQTRDRLVPVALEIAAHQKLVQRFLVESKWAEDFPTKFLREDCRSEKFRFRRLGQERLGDIPHRVPVITVAEQG